MNKGTYSIYPNVRTPQRGAERTRRGALRTGVIEENDSTVERGLAGQFAAVTHEADGYSRVYVFLTGTPPRWIGPFMVFVEEVVNAPV